MSTMKKDEFLTEFAERTGMTKKAAGETLGHLTDIIKEQLREEGNSFRLWGVGILRNKRFAPRSGVAPQTGEPYEVPSRMKIKFNGSDAFEKEINQQVEA